MRSGAAVLLALSIGTSSFGEPVPQKIRDVVGYVATKRPLAKDDRPQLLGTGFAASYSWASGEARQFFVTAKHVVCANKGRGPFIKPLFARFNNSAGRSEDFPLSGPWLFHRDKGVDLAVHAGLPVDAKTLLIGNDLWLDKATAESKSIGVGDDLFYVGLLPQVPGRDRVEPIVRFGRLALVPDDRSPDGTWLHYLDAANTPGHSGAPVFLWATATRGKGAALVVGARTLRLYGVVHNVLEWAKEQEVLTGETGTPIDYRTSGVTGVVPVEFLRQLIDSPEARRALGVREPGVGRAGVRTCEEVE